MIAFQNSAKKKGIKKSYLYRSVGEADDYNSNLRRIKNVNPEYIKVWAELLGTTPEYLNGETDEKEKPVAETDNELVENEKSQCEQNLGGKRLNIDKNEREVRHQKDLIRVARIEELMSEQGKRPVDLAVFLGMSRQSSYLTVVKNNQTTIREDRLRKIAEWLGTTIEYLNGDTEFRNLPALAENLEEGYLLETFRMCTTYEERRSLLSLCEKLRAKWNQSS